MAKRKAVREGEEFYFCTGETVRTVSECCDRLETLSDAAFGYHVNDQKNDIYAWINDCLDPALAKRIQYLTDRKMMIKELRIPKLKK